MSKFKNRIDQKKTAKPLLQPIRVIRSVIIYLLLSSFFSNTSHAQILAWDFIANTGGETTVNSTTTNANLNVSAISRGSGLSIPATGGNRYAGSFDAINYSTGTTSLATAISTNQYFQFTISAVAGFKFSLSTLDANFLRSTGNAPNSFQWQYSFDGFASSGNIASTITYNGSTTGSGTGGFVAANGTAQTQISLSSISALQNVASGITITIRLYGWGAGSTGSTFALGILSGNDLSIGGAVTISCTTPTAYSVTGGGGYCFGGTGVTVGVSNSQTGVNYQLYNGASTVGSPVAGTTGSPINFGNQTTAATYTVVATTASGGCTNSMSGNAIVTVNPIPLSSVAGQTNITCFAANDGTITVSASNGASPYIFSVDNGVTFLAATGTNLRLFTGLLPNTAYRIKVKDSNGCISK